jgi:adenosylmethionine-8-amino-7-oxononanoate aminotransferase
MDIAVMKKVHKTIYDAGVMVRLGGNNILMSPPLIITEGEVGRVLGALDAGLGSV